MDEKTMYKLTYGLFVVTASREGKQNGCIVNTVQQVTSQPNRISVAINKSNFTHDMVMETRKFNVSILVTAAIKSVWVPRSTVCSTHADIYALVPSVM